MATVVLIVLAGVGAFFLACTVGVLVLIGWAVGHAPLYDDDGSYETFQNKWRVGRLDHDRPPKPTEVTRERSTR